MCNVYGFVKWFIYLFMGMAWKWDVMRRVLLIGFACDLELRGPYMYLMGLVCDDELI